MRYSFILLNTVFLLSGCFSDSVKKQEDSERVTHVVFCWLREPGNMEQRKQIVEMTESFNQIPSVLDARAGGPIMSERAIVDDSFDVGIIVEVKDEEGLQAYLDHPIHQKAKKEVLLPLIDRVLVYDFAK